MNKLIKNTIIIVGILLSAIVLILNICVSAEISNNLEEKVKIVINSPIKLLIICILIILIYLIINKRKKIKISKNGKMMLLIIILIVYVLLQIVWINIRGAIPSNDQKNVYEIAIAIANEKEDMLIRNQYIELYTQQITLSTIYALIFKITKIQSPVLLQYINVIANAFTILGILFITKQLGKKLEVTKINSLVISLSFITLPLLSTFVYGDIISLPMCLFSVYFIMKYSETKKINYMLISMVLMPMAYMARMNNLIFIIAVTIYLLLGIFSMENKNAKKILKEIVVLILFVIISILPTAATKKYWENKLELEQDKTFPTTGFICMGMQEGERAKGWYNASPRMAFENLENAKKYYKEEIHNRLKIFIRNPVYCIKFYAIKTATMWAENTYAALWYNQSFNFGEIDGIENTQLQQKYSEDIDNTLVKFQKTVNIFQKAIVLIVFGSTLLVLIKNRKSIPNEVLLLVTIFIGGFLFHTIWEAKSRYIIPYIVVLMPITSISLEEYIYSKIKKTKNIIKRKLGNGENNEIIDSNSNL